MNISLAPVRWLILIGLSIFLWSASFSPSSSAGMIEICDNGLDDDQDGYIDAFDPDCQCNGRRSPNLVPNGEFNETTGCCTDLGQVNCLTDWRVLGPSPDYVSDNCSDNNLRPDVRFLANALNQGATNDGYIFSVVQMVDGRQFTESMGVCLDSPMEAGKAYEVTFQLANLRNDSPDLLFSLVGIDLCDRLGAYDTRGNSSFCELQLPVSTLGNVNAADLAEGWNNLTFEVIPEENIEAIFYTVDCGFTPSTNQSTFYMVMDAVSIREMVEAPPVPSIELIGHACQEDLNLRVTPQPDSHYQWYRDSVPIPGATDTLLLLTNGLTPFSGIYHVLISDAEGNCDLSAPYELNLPSLRTQVVERICAGESYEFAGNWIDSAGIYLDTLNSFWGCDSIIELQLEVGGSSLEVRSESICAGDNFVFAGQLLSETGQYQDSLLNLSGCDSIIVLELLVQGAVRSSFTDSICSGGVYFFAGELLTEEGVYGDTLQSTEGCDSIISLELTVLSPALGDTLYVEQALGTTYDFQGRNYAAAGLYEAILSAANGCDSTIYLALSFYDPCTLPMLVDANSIAASCAEAANGQIEVFVEGTFPPYRYSLDNQSFQLLPVFADLDSGQYSIEVEDAFGCSQSISIEVAVLDNRLQVDLGPDTSVYSGEQIDLEPIALNFEASDLIWSRDEVIRCLGCPVLTVSPEQGTLYQLEAIDEFGCSAFDEIWVEVIPPPEFFLPNAFSPNDDGINDVFRAEGTFDAIDRIERMQVYSRWGDLLFNMERKGQGVALGWNGLVDGQKAEAGVYVYTIQWKNFKGEIQQMAGDVLLVR